MGAAFKVESRRMRVRESAARLNLPQNAAIQPKRRIPTTNNRCISCKVPCTITFTVCSIGACLVCWLCAAGEARQRNGARQNYVHRQNSDCLHLVFSVSFFCCQIEAKWVACRRRSELKRLIVVSILRTQAHHCEAHAIQISIAFSIT